MTAGAPSLTLDSDALARLRRLSATRQFESGKRLVADLDIAAGEHVLDVGCGTGLLADWSPRHAASGLNGEGVRF